MDLADTVEITRSVTIRGVLSPLNTQPEIEMKSPSGGAVNLNDAHRHFTIVGDGNVAVYVHIVILRVYLIQTRAYLEK